MSSPSSPPRKPAPYARELIEKEIAHLKKRTGTRHAGETRRAWSKMIVTFVILALFGLWSLDAILFSYNRGDAINVYLYLHNYGNDRTALAVADSGLLTRDEVKQLNARQGAYQDYFKNTTAAETKAAALLAYMRQLDALHQSHYDQLSPLNKVRYFLFIKTGLIPPVRWSVLNSSLD